MNTELLPATDDASPVAIAEGCATASPPDMAQAVAALPVLLVFTDEEGIRHFKPAAIKGARWRNSKSRSLEYAALLAEEPMGSDTFQIEFVTTKE